MKTAYIDTNIILRFLLNDHPRLSAQAKKVVTDYELHIDPVVIAETVWVMQSFYKISRVEIAQKLEAFLFLPNASSDYQKELIHALSMYSQEAFSYIDCWLYCRSVASGISLATQDKKLARKRTSARKK